MKKGRILNIVVIAIISCCCFSESAKSQDIFNRSDQYNLDNFKPVLYNMQIREVNVKKSYIEIDGGIIYIAKNVKMKNGNTYSTQLLNLKGRNIDLASFEKYQRVRISAYKLPNGRMVATQIKKTLPLEGDLKKGDLTPR